MTAPLLLRGARLADGRAVDVVVRDGHVASVDPAGSRPAGDGLDLAGYLLLPAPAEPHAHLDKALLQGRVPNPAGDLLGAVEAMRDAYPTMTEDDIAARATAALATAVAHGYAQIRTHVDCGDEHGLRSVHALAAVRDRLADVVQVQVVALMRPSLTGPDGANQRAVLRAALDEGADLVGGVPHLEPDSAAATRILVETAAQAGRDLDLHTDEVTDASSTDLALLARTVLGTGFPGRVTASHCVSLGVHGLDAARRTADLVAAAGIGVVTLPQTNLYLQGRGQLVGQCRGLTAVEVLVSAGVTVAAGSDNWRDPFNPMSRIDALETASLLVTAGHRTPEDAYLRVSARVRDVLGAAPVAVAPGSPAHLLAIRAASLDEAVAGGSEERLVVHAGRVVADTRLTRRLDPLLEPHPLPTHA